MEDLKSKKSYLDYEFQDLTNKRALAQAELEKRQREERERITPDLESYGQKLKYLKEEIISINKEIEMEKNQLNVLGNVKIEKENRLEKIKEEHEKVQEEYISSRQKPLNIDKMIKGDEKGINIVDEELNKLKTKNDDLSKEIEKTETEYAVYLLITQRNTKKRKK